MLQQSSKVSYALCISPITLTDKLKSLSFVYSTIYFHAIYIWYNVITLSQETVSKSWNNANHKWLIDVSLKHIFIVQVQPYHFCPSQLHWIQFDWNHYHLTLVIYQLLIFILSIVCVIHLFMIGWNKWNKSNCLGPRAYQFNYSRISL